MGTWGVAIFSDDVAADVRDDYRERLADGVPGPEATDLVLADRVEELAHAETGPIVWLALAAAQSRVGRLEDRVRERALEIIDAGSDLPRWQEDPKLLRKRETTLSRLRSELIGPQRPIRRIPKPTRSVWPWDPGSVVSFRRSDGRCLLLRVVIGMGEHGVSGGRYGVVEVLHWIGETIPPADAIDAIPAARAIDWSATDGHPRLHGIMILNQRQLDRFALVVGRHEPAPQPVDGVLLLQHFVISADDLERLAATRFGLE